VLAVSVLLAVTAQEATNNQSHARLDISAPHKLGLELSSHVHSAATIQTLDKVQSQLVCPVQQDPCVTRELQNFSLVHHPKAAPQEGLEPLSVLVAHTLAEEAV